MAKKRKIETTKHASEAIGSYGLWKVILAHLDHRTSKKQRLEFTIDMNPVSTNHQYNKRIYKNKKTGRMILSQSNTDEVEVLRIKVKSSIAKTGKLWGVKGTVACMIMIESKHWLNKDRSPKKRDVDNQLKTLLDSIEKATGVPDETNFQVMVFKVPSSVEKTRVYMYDLEEKYFSLEQ